MIFVVVLDTENQYHGIPSALTNLRPEDDILYQWRVRRRLEQARQHSQGVVVTAPNPVESHIPSSPNKV